MIEKYLKPIHTHIGKLFIQGYNTIDGTVSGLQQIRIGFALGMWFIQFNIFVYSLRFGIIQK